MQKIHVQGGLKFGRVEGLCFCLAFVFAVSCASAGKKQAASIVKGGGEDQRCYRNDTTTVVADPSYFEFDRARNAALLRLTYDVERNRGISTGNTALALSCESTNSNEFQCAEADVDPNSVSAVKLTVRIYPDKIHGSVLQMIYSDRANPAAGVEEALIDGWFCAIDR